MTPTEKPTYDSFMKLIRRSAARHTRWYRHTPPHTLNYPPNTKRYVWTQNTH